MEEKCSECGIWNIDPIHEPWHKVITWNMSVYQSAREKAMKEFEKRVNPSPTKRRRKLG